jgi:excisionase family DNA binding protein
MSDIQRQTYTVRQFCETYNLCRDRFYQLVRAGSVRCVKQGRRTLIHRSDAEAWAKSLPELRL